MNRNDPVAIRVRGLKNSFGPQVVHEGLDLDVRNGEILGVVGGSGTGKSVLMRSIIGLQRPDEGEVLVFGESMERTNLTAIANAILQLPGAMRARWRSRSCSRKGGCLSQSPRGGGGRLW